MEGAGHFNLPSEADNHKRVVSASGRHLSDLFQWSQVFPLNIWCCIVMEKGIGQN